MMIWRLLASVLVVSDQGQRQRQTIKQEQAETSGFCAMVSLSDTELSDQIRRRRRKMDWLERRSDRYGGRIPESLSAYQP